jgi:hypothetical protein
MVSNTIPVKDIMQDVVRNTVTTGFFDKIKINAGKKGVSIEALESNKQVILKATTQVPVSGWEGEFGLANLSLLQSMVNDPEFAHKDSKLDMQYQARGGVDTPSELHYTNKSGTFVAYRFVSKELVPDQPKYNEPTWDVTVKPVKSAIQQFAWASNSLSSYEQYFIPKTVDGALKFFIGEENGANQRGGVIFAQGVTGEFESNHKWPISQIAQVLKLTDGTDAEVKLSVKGALQIDLKTGLVDYKFVFPAKMR